MDYQLSYEGKKTENEIREAVQPSELEVSEQVGDPVSQSKNMLVHGENLSVLRALRDNPDVKGNVQLIYIDPPYSSDRIFSSKNVWYQSNTEAEEEKYAYSDKMDGAEYLEFLRERLVLLKDLLSEEGTIYVHLDDNSAFSVKILMDEIFGKSGFRSWVTRRKCSSKNYTKKDFGDITDYLMCYSKSDNPVWNRPYKDWEKEHAEEEYPRVEEETGRRFKQVPIYAPGERNGATGEPWRGMDPPEGKHWSTTPEKLDELDEQGRIYWSPTGNPRKKVYLDESEGVPYTNLWMEFRDAHNQNVSVTGYPTEKNQDMLEMLVRASSDPGGLVLDCFCGSGTTLAAAMRENRYWIGVDSSELALDTSKERLEEVALENSKDLFNQQYNPGFSLIRSEIPETEARAKEEK